MNHLYSSLTAGFSLLSMLSVPPASAHDEYPPDPEAVFEKGKLYKYGKINVLDLKGSYREMGRQYGGLMSEELQRLYQKAVIDHFMDKKGLSSESMLNAAKGLYYFYPQRFKDIILGMSETSGLSLDDQIILNALELYGLMPGCSGIFAWEEYTGGAPLIVGRNYDWFDSYADFAKSLTVTVFQPDSGIPTAIITFAGVIYATTGINSHGLFLELNNAFPSGGGLTHQNRVCAMSNLLAFLLDYQSMDQLDAAMNTTRSNFSFIINTADKHSAISYE
ncbi:MAG: C45 family peptidase [Desulfonatronovibrio sp.]